MDQSNMNGEINGMGIHKDNMDGAMNGMGMNNNMGYGGGGYGWFGEEDNVCVTDYIKCDVNQYTTTPTPTPSTPSKQKYHKSTSTYAHLANLLLKTINFILEDIKQWAILDSSATSNFLLSDAPMNDER